MTHLEVPTRSYVHYPRLVVGNSSVAVLGGTVRSLEFETFRALEPDWARQDYYEQTQPAFWIREEHGLGGPPAPGDETALDPSNRAAMLVYSALLAVTGRLYPDARLSMTYRVRERAVAREVGPFERTWLLNGGGLEPTNDEELRSLAALAEEWHAQGFRHDQPVLSPLRGIASLASTFMRPAMGMLPLIVSLEGFLIPRPVKGIARQMVLVTKGLLAQAAPADLEGLMQGIYEVRSRIIHGERILDEQALSLCGRLQKLTGDVVIAASREMTRRGIEPHDLDALRKDWIQA